MSNWVTLKRAIVGSVLLAAISVVPAFAASPTVSDAGSSWSTARVYGSGFTASTWWSPRTATVEIVNWGYDYYYNLYETVSYDTVATSTSGGCWGTIWSCTVGGTFSFEKYMTGVGGCAYRYARARDDASGLWSTWIPLQCS